MKNLFSPENPVIQFLSRVGEMMIANALFLLCSLPVLTGGAALTALNRVMQDIALGEDAGVVKPFFRAFRDNFRQATVGWLMLLVFLTGMGGNLLLALSYLTGNALLVCKWVLGALTLWILSVGCWYFQLLARYDNTVRQHLTNGAILTAVKLPRSLAWRRWPFCRPSLPMLPCRYFCPRWFTGSCWALWPITRRIRIYLRRFPGSMKNTTPPSLRGRWIRKSMFPG